MREVDLTFLDWQRGLNANTTNTGGSYYKAVDADKNYYKLSLFDDGIQSVISYEAVLELIVTRLCNILGIACVQYRLVKAKILEPVLKKPLTTYVCVSSDFRGKAKKITAETLYKLERQQGELPLDCFRRLGYSDYFDAMLLLDFLIINRDRHGANIEFNQDSRGIHPVPLFDNGFSFTAPQAFNISAVTAFDAMQDVPVNNFIGSRSLVANLNLIQKPVVVNRLVETSRRAIMYGLRECLPDEVRNKIWEIIERRYIYARDRKILVER